VGSRNFNLRDDCGFPTFLHRKRKKFKNVLAYKDQASLLPRSSETRHSHVARVPKLHHSGKYFPLFNNDELKLLHKEPEKRLGTANGIREVLAHPWFSDIDQEKLLAMKIEAPFKPTLSSDVLDVSNFDKAFTSEEAVISVIQPQKMNKV